MDIVVGSIDAFIGGYLFNAIGLVGTTGLSIWSIFVAFIGAIVLLTLIRLFSGRRRLSN